jgi:hypothetical protein
MLLQTPGHGGSNPRNQGVYKNEASCETARGVFMAHNPKGYANCIAVEMKDDINYADLGTIS